MIKGDVAESVQIRSGTGGSDCGYLFELGQSYGVVPYESIDGGWAASICGEVWEPDELRSVRPIPAPRWT